MYYGKVGQTIAFRGLFEWAFGPRIFMKNRATMLTGQMVGRTPWSARDALVPLPGQRYQHHAKRQQADGGVGRGPGGPPHHFLRVVFRPCHPSQKDGWLTDDKKRSSVPSVPPCRRSLLHTQLHRVRGPVRDVKPDIDGTLATDALSARVPSLALNAQTVCVATPPGDQTSALVESRSIGAAVAGPQRNASITRPRIPGATSLEGPPHTK